MIEKYFVYVLSSKLRRYLYVGMTYDFDRRMRDHQSGYNRTTKPYLPFDLILKEEYMTRDKARIREKELKTSSGKRWLYKKREVQKEE